MDGSQHKINLGVNHHVTARREGVRKAGRDRVGLGCKVISWIGIKSNNSFSVGFASYAKGCPGGWRCGGDRRRGKRIRAEI